MQETFFKNFVIKSTDFDEEEGTFKAYITTFENSDRVNDVVSKGALDEFIASFNPEEKILPMYYNHNSKDLPVGEWQELEADEYGVSAKGVIFTDTSRGADMYSLLKKGKLKDVSIGFYSTDYEKKADGGKLFNKISLIETSVVATPANPLARITSVKSAEGGLIDLKALKDVLYDAGLQRKEIDALFAKGWSGITALTSCAEGDEDARKAEFIEAIKNYKF